MKFLKNIENKPFLKIVISIIWGLGLAAIFRRACKGRDCIRTSLDQRYDE